MQTDSNPTPFHGVVAIDGPSGSGKSTVAKRLAVALHAGYLDTGAMYRAATWAVLAAGVDRADPAAVAACVRSAPLSITTDPVAVSVRVGDHAVDAEIRGPEVTAAVSAVSGVPAVRTQLIAEQRRLIEQARAGNGIVVEGRDIGAVVAPDAELKVFLTADAAERARRRSAETDTDVTATAADLHRRDSADSKVTTPLAAADGAVHVDTTHQPIDEVVDGLLGLLSGRAAAGVETP